MFSLYRAVKQFKPKIILWDDFIFRLRIGRVSTNDEIRDNNIYVFLEY